MSVQVQHRPFTVQEYYRLAQVGIFKADERVELIAGEILNMVPIGTYHASEVDRLTQFFVTNYGNNVIVRVQNPVRMDERSEPQPDIALLKPKADFYAARHPEPQDGLLLIEVADTSLEYDRTIKLPLYAKPGIPEVWIVNLPEQCIEVYAAAPDEQRYRKRKKVRVGSGKTLRLTTLPQVRIPVDEILG